MFNVQQKYIIDNPITKMEFIKYYPTSLSNINNHNSIINICVGREDSYITLQNSFINLEFEVLKNDNTRFANADDIKLVNLGPIALFSEASIKTSSGKHLEKIDNLHTVSLMYKLLTTHKNTSELMYGFEIDDEKRKEELLDNKTVAEKGTFFVRIKLTDIFGFADQEKITYGLGYQLILKRNTNDDAIFRAGGDAAKIVIKNIDWNIAHYTPSIQNQTLVKEQILNKEPTELKFLERTVFRKNVDTNNNWIFELGQSENLNPVYIIVGFMRQNKFNSQTQNNSVFDTLPIIQAQTKIGSENFPENAILCNYNRYNYCEAYYEIENFFKMYTQTDF